MDGEQIHVNESGILASSGDPRQLIIEFLSEENVAPELVARMQRYEWGDGYMTIYLALDGAVNFFSGSDAQRSAYVHAMSASPEYLSLAYTQCRSGILPATPFILMCNDSAVDSEPCSREQSGHEDGRPQRPLSNSR